MAACLTPPKRLPTLESTRRRFRSLRGQVDLWGLPSARRRQKAPLQRRPTTALIKNPQLLGRYSIYEARAVAAGFAFCFTAAISVFAAGPDEWGFCPVISRPSVTPWDVQFAVFEKTAPSFNISSSTRKGTTLVRPTASSSPLVKPVTSLPCTKNLPSRFLT